MHTRKLRQSACCSLLAGDHETLWRRVASPCHANSLWQRLSYLMLIFASLKSSARAVGVARRSSVLALSVAALDYAKRCAESFMLHILWRYHVAITTKWRAHLTQFFALIEVRQARPPPPSWLARNLPEQY